MLPRTRSAGWPSGDLIGIQTPRIALRPDTAVDFTASESAFNYADAAKRRRPPWQNTVIRDGMAKDANGKWTAFEVGVLVSRQNGKNGCAEIVELGWMIDEPGVQILHTAHKFSTALKSMQRLVALLKSSPDLWKHVAPKGVRYGNGRESITFTNGSFIAFRTRTNQGGRGESFDRLVIDEAMVLSPAAYAALEPLLTTADQPGSDGPGGQIWYLGSAADSDSQEHCGHWASVRDRALEGEPDLLWLEWSAEPPPADATPDERAAWRADRRNWAQANPSIGYLITEEYVAKTLRSARNALEKWEIERLSVGRWPKPFEDAETVVDMAIWADQHQPEPRVAGPIALALSMNGARTSFAIGAATYSDDGDRRRIRLELGYHGDPVGAIERVIDLVARWDPCAVVINSSSPAAALVPKLREAGIEPELTSSTESAAAAGGFVDDALAGLLSHADDPRVNASLAAVQKRPMAGGTFGWDYSSGDTTPVEVISLARYGLLTYGVESRPTQSPTQDDTGTTAEVEDALMSMGF